MNERLKKLREIGQSVWVDSLSRDDIQNGNLQRMTEVGVLGVTSNPTILQQAIAQSELYDQELQELAEKTDDPREIFRRIAVRDIRDASDIFMPVYEQTEHKEDMCLWRSPLSWPSTRRGPSHARSFCGRWSTARTCWSRSRPQRRAWGDRRLHRGRDLGQRHPDLLA